MKPFSLKRNCLRPSCTGVSLHVDGEGTLLTTEECLLMTTRNNTLQGILKRNSFLRKSTECFAKHF
ncbi:MAG TPA: agmatine deiminase family protein, partial [Desulfosporosinus sp.]|nr:agmatine deiminase family protein [Desulfosporosinus sp.]